MATAVSYKEIDLSWTDNSANEDGFTIARRLTSDTSATAWKPIATVPAGTTSYQDASGLNPRTSYSYLVRAFNQFGVSEWCSQKSATTLAYAGSGTPYLASLTVYPPGIKEGETSTATMTLSAPAPAGGTTVTLTDNNANAVTLPSMITIPTGNTSAQFTITALAGVSTNAGCYVILKAQAAGWLQTATVVTMPATYSYVPQSLDADAGNGNVILSWDQVPPGCVRGYHVFRRQGQSGAGQELTGSAQEAELFADTTASNGTTYQYCVVAEDWRGQYFPSGWVTGVPASSLPTMSRVNPPQSPVSNAVALTTTVSSSDTAVTRMLIVDGRFYGYGTGDGANPDVTQGQCLLDTKTLSNGNHTVQVLGASDNYVFSTPPLTLTVDNASMRVTADPFFDTGQGEVASISASLPSGTTHWQVQLTDAATQAVVYSRVGTGDGTARLAWDGSDDTGGSVLDGNYDLVITAFDANNQA